MNKNFLKCGGLLILAIVIYWPVFHAPFCWDDHVILDNLHRVWNFQSSRLLTNLTFLFNFQIGGLNTFGYHLVNLLFHLLTAGGVWVFAQLTMRCLKIPQSTDIPFWSAVLFLVHPINTEAVSYLNGRSTALATMCYVWAVVCFLQARLTQGKEAIKYYVGLTILTVMALLSKEISMTLPFAWMLVERFILNRRISKVLWLSLILVVVIVIGLFDFKIASILLSPVQSQSHLGDQLTLGTYLLTQLKVLVVFLKLMFVPTPLILDYDFPMSESFFELTTLLSGVFLFIILVVSFIQRKKLWWVTWLIWWFFISLFTHILPPRGNVIAEHKLYLTLVLFLPIFLIGLRQYISSRILIIGLILVSSLFAWLTYQRNLLWANPVLLWEETTRRSPQKARPYLNLGVAHFEQGNLVSAKAAYLKALELSPVIEEAYSNLAVIYQQELNFTQSKEYAERLLRLNPNSAVAYLQLASLSVADNQYQNSIDYLSKALAINPHSLKAYRMRGYLYEKVAQDTLAIEDYSVWLKHYPRDEKVLERRSDLYFKRKMYEQSLGDYNQLMAIRSTQQRIDNRAVLKEILKNKANDYQKP